MYEDDFEAQSARTSFSVSRSRNKPRSHRSPDRHRSENDERAEGGGLTSAQLKAKLIESVRSKGILSAIKSQLRNKLALELNANIEQTRAKHQGRSNLALTTINCLLVDHLRANEYDYTLSVFMAECGMGAAEVYGLEDVLHVLKVSRQSRLYAEVSEEAGAVRQRGLLWHLVSYLCSR